MREQDWPQFQAVMREAELCTAMPNGKDIGDVTAALFKHLAPYPIETVKAAVSEHCKHERFFPMLADIVSRIEGDIDERAALAWTEVDAAALKTGGERSVRFADPAIHWAILKMRGWESLAWRIKRDGEWLKKDFTEYYRAAVKQHVTWADVPAVMDGTFTYKVYDTAAGKCFPLHELPALEATA